MKTINDLTIKEYTKYAELSSVDEIDTFSILELFGCDPYEMKANELNNTLSKIVSATLKTNKVKRYYKVGNYTLKSNLNLLNITAAQFIDLQTYLKDYKLEQILTVFLVPCRKTVFGYKEMTYANNKEYDINELSKTLFENFKMSDANTLSSFFFTQSLSLLKVTKAYSEKKLLKETMNLQKKVLKNLK